jgi:hypothetical protein
MHITRHAAVLTQRNCAAHITANCWISQLWHWTQLATLVKLGTSQIIHPASLLDQGSGPQAVRPKTAAFLYCSPCSGEGLRRSLLQRLELLLGLESEHGACAHASRAGPFCARVHAACCAYMLPLTTEHRIA